MIEQSLKGSINVIRGLVDLFAGLIYPQIPDTDKMPHNGLAETDGRILILRSQDPWHQHLLVCCFHVTFKQTGQRVDEYSAFVMPYNLVKWVEIQAKNEVQ